MKHIVLAAACAAGTLCAQNQPNVMFRTQVQGTFQAQATAEAGVAIAARGEAVGAQTVAFVSGMVNGPTVTGVPYSAEAVTETTQTLSDGNRIEQKTSSKQYRDGEGRERREESTNMKAVFITDPVAKVNFTLHPETKTAEKLPFLGAFFLHTGDGTGVADTKIVTKEITRQVIGRSISVDAPDVSQTTTTIAAPMLGAVPAQRMMFFNSDTGATQPKIEDLGTRSIEGVSAQGTRSTITIPAGQIGNIRPIEIIDESWFSPDLKMMVMTRHSDPRSGEMIYKLTNIQRIEPVRSMFEVPTDYTLIDHEGEGKFNQFGVRNRTDIVRKIPEGVGIQ